MTQKYNIVQFPEKGKSRCLEAVCYGNSRIGSLLDYFIYGANQEAEHQHLEKGCKVVTFSRKHRDILEKLNFNLSRKTLIRYLDLLSEWGYVSSTTYLRTFSVNADKIQSAIDNPPRKPVRAPREGKLPSTKSCNVVDLQHLKIVEELQEKVVTLQQNVVDLQQNVVTLQQKVDILSTLQPSLRPLPEQPEGHNFDPYSNYSNIQVITREYISQTDDSAGSTFVPNGTPSLFVSPSVSPETEDITTDVDNSAQNEDKQPSDETPDDTRFHVATVTTRNTSSEDIAQDTSSKQNTFSFNVPASAKPASAKRRRDTEPLVPQMPPADAPWPSKETAVRIVEAKKGRAYSPTTRKQELLEAGKVLEMTIDGTAITREQFESAWDDIASSSWWDEHGKPCMIKYLRKDDTIIGIVKKLMRKGPTRAKTTSNHVQPTTTVKVDDDIAKRNLERMFASVGTKEIIHG